MARETKFYKGGETEVNWNSTRDHCHILPSELYIQFWREDSCTDVRWTNWGKAEHVRGQVGHAIVEG